MNERIIGTVLWISERDGNGIIVSNKTEYYFDKSTCTCFADLKRNDIIAFERNDKIKEVKCAKNVSNKY